MQGSDVVVGDAVLPEVSVHTAGVLPEHFGFRAAEKAILKLADEILFDEVLHPEEDDLFQLRVAGLAGREVGVDEGSAFRVLKFMAHFVAVFQENGG